MSQPRKSAFRSVLLAGATVFLLGLTATNVSQPANAQTPGPGEDKSIYRFMAVNKWEGSFSWEGSGAGEATVPNGQLKWQSTENANGTFMMEGPTFPYEGQENIAVWRGPAIGTGNVNTEITISKTCTHYDRWTGSGSIPGILGSGEPGYVAPEPYAQLELDLETGEYHLAVSPESLDVSNYWKDICGAYPTDGTAEYTTQLGAGGFSNGHAVAQVPDSGLNLDGNVTFSDQIPQMWDISDVSGEVPWSYNWSIHPAGKADVEMVVSPQNFDTWLPEGGTADVQQVIGVGASKPGFNASTGVEVEYSGGNTLTVTAKLQGVDGAELKQKARKITFELMNVSNEPGIAMNMPSVKAKQDKPDLEFDALDNLPLQVKVTGSNQAETTKDGLTEATAIIHANDYGAWGVLKVTAELESGQQIVGYLEGDKNQKEIRIPKREISSKVADYWKKLYGAGGRADDDDAELSPVGLEGCYGDGLTLYEEYRGFFENRKHIRTRPDRRDYFVTDRIGTAFSRAGIAMFKQATQLEVHGEMRLDEFSDNLVINFNHAAAPHEVDQHGVQLVSRPSPGMPGVAVKKMGYSGLGTPGTFAWVVIDSGLKPQSGSEEARRYATIVAHELAHTVGVSEHGVGDKQLQWMVWDEDGVMVVHELTLEPGSTKPPVKIVVKTEDGTVIPATSPIFGDADGVIITLGVKGGQHSGVEACLMRYDTAWAYASSSEKNVRYYVKGDEHREALLCSTAMGTGVNDPAHEPQPRYGPAGPNKGDCLHQVCVNDAVTVPQR